MLTGINERTRLASVLGLSGVTARYLEEKAEKRVATHRPAAYPGRGLVSVSAVHALSGIRAWEALLQGGGGFVQSLCQHMSQDCAGRLTGEAPCWRNCAKAKLENTHHNAFHLECP
ncbi:unnamed protein product [Arctia plantaginis]|uniref:Uncharacterized protein n=1 Tax=Arctia plantaginis TaxID=874455 RepID=A0A8S0YS02_ARCPL|nr:unnamed protein product [Arctia plantaginis]